MNLADMNDEQLALARKVGLAAIRYGLNPDFVLPMVQAESDFRHIKNPNSDAFGVMQLMPATAKGLKVNPQDIDQNIEGGMRLLKELVANKNIGNDPYRVLAGYNARPTTKFLTSGDLVDLPDETLKHMARVSGLHGGDLPSVLFNAPYLPSDDLNSSPKTAPIPSTNAAPPIAPVVVQSDKVKDIPKDGGGTSEDILPKKSFKELAILGAPVGAATAAGYGTFQGLRSTKNAIENLAQVVRNGATAPEVNLEPPGVLTDRQIQGTQGENTGRARSTGFNETTAQRAARQKELYAYAEKLGLNPSKVFADFPDVGSTSSGVLAPRAAINDAIEAATARGKTFLNSIRSGLTQASPYINTGAKVIGSTLGGIGAAVQGYDTSRDMQQNGLTPRNAAKAFATAGSLAAMVPSGLTQLGGAVAQLPAAGFDIYDYAANRLATDPVINYETVPTMLPRQRSIHARPSDVYPAVQ
jgi:hypothetical protein